VLPISWAYVKLMGGSGLTEATKSALLAANYVASRLNEFFPVLYTGEGGLVAHECILDLRELTARTGVTAEDVAKRLIDYGFHAPTLAFPVAGTLMVEPTESEDLAEIDRFIDAMITIRAEIEQVANGDFTVENSPLRNAPHTAAAVVSSRLGPFLPARAGRLPRAHAQAGQVLPAGGPHRRCSRRPQPGLLLPADRSLREHSSVRKLRIPQ
jgi:glycine dehydrogenase